MGNKIMIRGIHQKAAEKLQKTAEGRAMLAAIDCLEFDIARAKELLQEADGYLNTNKHTSIGHGSILHAEFNAIGNEL